jgi:hypothetical protein
VHANNDQPDYNSAFSLIHEVTGGRSSPPSKDRLKMVIVCSDTLTLANEGEDLTMRCHYDGLFDELGIPRIALNAWPFFATAL